MPFGGSSELVFSAAAASRTINGGGSSACRVKNDELRNSSD